MRLRQIFCLGLAIASAGGAYVIQRKKGLASAPAVVMVAPETADILVASADFPSGKILSGNDLHWQAWPKTLLTPSMIIRSIGSPADIPQDVTGKRVKIPVGAGEPIRRDRLDKAGPGFLASLLRSGHRAVSIAIDSQGSTTAGGFVLPNDHVDVISTSQTGTKYTSELLLANVRVLAIGKTVESGSERMVSGTTATLEVTPQQAELLAMGQRGGQLSLALRASGDDSLPNSSQPTDKQASLTTVSVSRNGARQDYSVPESGFRRPVSGSLAYIPRERSDQ